MNMPTSDQVSSVLRTVGGYGAGAGTVLVVLGLLDAQHANDAVAAFRDVTDGLQQAVGGAYKLIAIVGPAAAGAIAWFGQKKATLSEQMKSVTKNSADPITNQPTVKIAVAPDAPAPALALAKDTSQPAIVTTDVAVAQVVASLNGAAPAGTGRRL